MKERMIRAFKEYKYGTDDYLADGLIKEGFLLPPLRMGTHVYAQHPETGDIECFVIMKICYDGTDFEFVATLENENGDTLFAISFNSDDIGKTVFVGEGAEKQAKATLQ